MPIREQLDLTGYRGQPIPNTFLRQETATTRVAILYPGSGYSYDMPLFYYATQLLWNAGADVLQVAYTFHHLPGFQDLPAPERRQGLLADTAAAFEAISQQQHYQQLILIGKSLGTLAMGHLLTAKPLQQDTRAVWLTPLLRDPDLREQMRICRAPSLAIIGTADHDYDEDYLREFGAGVGNQVITIEGAGHSLDLVGDPVGSIRAMERVAGAIEEFLAQ